MRRRLSIDVQVAGAEDVVVVVSRWFGGVLLGPSRFTLINNTARALLEQQVRCPRHCWGDAGVLAVQLARVGLALQTGVPLVVARRGAAQAVIAPGGKSAGRHR